MKLQATFLAVWCILHSVLTVNIDVFPKGRLALIRSAFTDQHFCDKIPNVACERLEDLWWLCPGKCEGNFEADKSQVWWDLAQNELEAALNYRKNENRAKNVVLFLGDGMGITAATAGRIHKGQLNGMHGEEGYLAWEQFPNMGLLKTYTVNKQVPDSAGTATAYLCGIKTNTGTLGVSPDVKQNDCYASLKSKHRASSIVRWAQDAKKHTGIITTTRVTHATPAATYAHSAHRNWEGDSDLGPDGQGCKDIADQLITGETGKNIRVILGGGRSTFTSGRLDGRNLTREWYFDKMKRLFNARYVTNAKDLASVNSKNTDFLLGLFHDSHMSWEIERKEDEPSLADMTLKAIEILSKNKNGFFLLVEAGRIDHGLHFNDPQKALGDIVALDEAVTAALKELDLEETLVLVTADHSHVMTMNGYPDRGNDILDVAGLDKEGTPYNTLLFTNGPDINVAVPLDMETHGGEDVAVYAAGPWSHLFQHVHEQNYVAHVMAYAACISPNQKHKCPISKRRPNFNSYNKSPIWEERSFAQSSSRNVLESVPVVSKQLQQNLDYQHDQMVSKLGSEYVPRTALYNDTDNHIY